MGGAQRLFNVPPGAVADVKIIDSTSKIGKLPVEFLMEPPIPGFHYMPDLPSWSFLVESGSGQKALFDLGIPKRWQEMAPAIVNSLVERGWTIEVEKDVSEILTQNGYRLESINSIIWSHWHWDHLGDPSLFPGTTELVVGPGFKDNLMPGYPIREDAKTRESDFRGREVRGLKFDGQQAIQIGDFRALDFFGDGSFYILDAPGHAIGHICGLTRTSANPDTFIFMGGDLCHHGGEMRPSVYVPLPKEISPHPLAKALQPSCPGAMFEVLQQQRQRTVQQPFFNPGIGLEIPEAIRSIRKAQKADAEDNVLFIYAHDTTVRGVANLFPLKANDWRNQGWRQKMFWGFLEDFEAALKDIS